MKRVKFFQKNKRDKFEKKFVLLFVFNLLASFVFAQAENSSLELFTFGPKESDNALVLCFTSSLALDNLNNETQLLNKVRKLAKEFSEEQKNNLDFKLLIAISHNDYTNLPEDIEVKTFVGMRTLMDEITKYKRASVFIFDDSDEQNISYKADNTKSPVWMIKLFNESAEGTGFDIHSKVFSLGKNDLQNIETLNIFFNENIPALLIKVKDDIDLELLINNLSKNFLHFFLQDWEQNYFIFFNLQVLSERTNIIFISVFCVIIFLILFLQLVIGKKTLTKKELFTIGIIYIFFVVESFIFLQIAKSLSNFIFKAFIGSAKPIEKFNAYYIIIYISIVLFQILIFHTLLSLIQKKTNLNFEVLDNIYPRISLINFFVLVVFDFSIYPFAFFNFLVSNLYFFVKNIFWRTLILSLGFLPTIIYFIVVVGNPISTVDIFQNKILFLSLLTIPVVFIFSTIYTFSKKYFKRKFFISVAAFIFLLAIVFLTFSFSSKKYRSEIEIRQIFTDNKNSSIIKSQYDTKKNLELDNLPEQNQNSNEFFQIEKKLENYLDRSLGTISISSPLEVEAVQVFISNDEGVSVYEADRDFFLDDEGVKFLSSQKPKMPFKINFSSEKNANLNILVKIFSYENIFETRLKDSNQYNLKYNENFLLQAETKFTLKAGQ